MKPERQCHFTWYGYRFIHGFKDLVNAKTVARVCVMRWNLIGGRKASTWFLPMAKRNANIQNVPYVLWKIYELLKGDPLVFPRRRRIGARVFRLYSAVKVLRMWKWSHRAYHRMEPRHSEAMFTESIYSSNAFSRSGCGGLCMWMPPPV